MLTDRPLAGKKQPYARSVVAIFQVVCLLVAFLLLRVVLFQNGLLQHSLCASSSKHRWWPLGAATVSCVLLYWSININEAGFSNERVLGEVAKNGQFAFVSAAVTRHLDYTAFYKTVPR